MPLFLCHTRKGGADATHLTSPHQWHRRITWVCVWKGGECAVESTPHCHTAQSTCVCVRVCFLGVVAGERKRQESQHQCEGREHGEAGCQARDPGKPKARVSPSLFLRGHAGGGMLISRRCAFFECLSLALYPSAHADLAMWPTNTRGERRLAPPDHL